MLRVETTINNSELPGLKLKKQACHLQAYYWYGLGCNSRYLNTLADIDMNSPTSELYEKYQKPVVNAKGVRVAAPDLRKDGQLELFCLLMSDKGLVYGFNNKQWRLKLKNEPKTARIAYELRKLRERGAIIKLKGSHYYRLTQEGYVWLYSSLFNYGHFVNPLLSMRNKKAVKSICENPSEVEKAYSMIDKAISLVTRELNLVA